MAEVLESHLRETLGIVRDDQSADAVTSADFEDTMRILRTYLK